VLLEVQRSLLAVVTPELRAVAVGLDGRRVTVRFSYDLPVDALDDALDRSVDCLPRSMRCVTLLRHVGRGRT